VNDKKQREQNVNFMAKLPEARLRRDVMQKACLGEFSLFPHGLRISALPLPDIEETFFFRGHGILRKNAFCGNVLV
jgi:hypothetical protein